MPKESEEHVHACLEEDRAIRRVVVLAATGCNMNKTGMEKKHRDFFQ